MHVAIFFTKQKEFQIEISDINFRKHKVIQLQNTISAKCIQWKIDLLKSYSE